MNFTVGSGEGGSSGVRNQKGIANVYTPGGLGMKGDKFEIISNVSDRKHLRNKAKSVGDLGTMVLI